MMAPAPSGRKMPNLTEDSGVIVKKREFCLLGVTHGIVQQRGLRVGKLQQLFDGGSVHRHARAGHEASSSTEEVHIFAHDSRIDPHDYLGLGVTASKLLLVGDNQEAHRSGLCPVLAVGNQPAMVTLRHLLQRVFLVQVFEGALGRKHEHADFLKVACRRGGNLAFGGAVHTNGREEQVGEFLVGEHLVAELGAGTAAPEGLHHVLAERLGRRGEFLDLRHAERAAKQRGQQCKCKFVLHGDSLVDFVCNRPKIYPIFG